MKKILLQTGAAITASTILLGNIAVFAAEEGEGISCEYAGKFQQCIEANKNGTTRSIKDFVCLQSNNSEAILDQIILDETFKEIDEEIMQYLVALDEDKEFAATQTNRALDDITKNFRTRMSVFQKV